VRRGRRHSDSGSSGNAAGHRTWLACTVRGSQHPASGGHNGQPFCGAGWAHLPCARASVSLAWVFAQLFPVYSIQVFRTHRSSAGPAVLNAIGSRSELCRVKSRRGAEQARPASSAPVHRHSCHPAALTTARSIPPRNPPESRSRAGKKASCAPYGIAGSVHGISSVDDPVLPKVCPHPFVDQLGLLIFGLATE
jgi:hypothetical protein